MTIEKMKERKKELGFSCEKLAELAGLPYSTVQKVFSGATKSPRRKTIVALEKILDAFGTYKYYEPLTPEDNLMCVRDGSAAYDIEPADRSNTDRKFKKGSYTLDDYYALPDDQRVELIDGVFYDMAAPAIVHQAVLASLFAELHGFVKKNKGKCKVFPAPVDVRLDKDDKTMVQPDIAIICDKDKITDKRVEGAPDMVVEILSPSTSRKDCILKLYKYYLAGVREYWMVDPKLEKVVIYCFDGDHPEIPTVYGFDSKIPVHIWEDKCIIDFSEIRKELN